MQELVFLRRRESARGIALLDKGFRPFFLVAALHGALLVPLWLLVLSGTFVPASHLPITAWHAHEMVYGFAVAVIAGFLLTAVGNWTGKETATGKWLAGLVGLWVAGRVALLTPGLPAWLAAGLALSFLPGLAIAIGRPLVATGNRRNYGFLAILAALWASQLAVHLGALGLAPGWERLGSLVGVDLVIVAILVVAGRVVPMFTRNATGAPGIRKHPVLDRITVGGAALLVVLDAVAPGSVLAASVAGATGVFALARAAHWGTLHTLRIPLLWVLHLGYAFVPLGLLLRVAVIFDPSIGPSLATHALTVGAIGLLTLGMMARVALGHTGRPLVAPRLVAVAFGGLALAALVRVVGPLVGLEWYHSSLEVSGSLWAAAFLCYLVAYVPILLRPRVDGRPG